MTSIYRKQTMNSIYRKQTMTGIYRNQTMTSVYRNQTINSIYRKWGMIHGKYRFEDNVASEVELSTLVYVFKDKNEMEELLSAVSSNDQADDITKHEDDNPKLVRKGAAKIDWTIITFI